MRTTCATRVPSVSLVHVPARSPRLHALLLSLGSVLLASAPAVAQADLDGWEPADAAEGPGYAYRVYSKQAEGERFVRYRVLGTIEVPAEGLPASVRVIASDPGYVPDGQSRRVLVDDPAEFVVYTRIDLPPLFSDRDIVSRGVPSFDATRGVHRIDWRTFEHEAAPPVDGVIRIVRAAGSWEFTPADAGTAEVDYQTHIDLGGSLPRWLTQPLMTRTVAKNFEDLARLALSRRTAALD